MAGSARRALCWTRHGVKVTELVDLDTLRALVDRGDGRDRAFVDGMIRMAWSRAHAAKERTALGVLHDALREASLRSHEAIRREIASGARRRDELRAYFDAVPVFERDHHVEEVLGIAYPPLDEPALGPELLAYAPSGYDEIVHAFDTTKLREGDRFLDVGAGTGKAVLLAALLSGATCVGIECNRALNDVAESASRQLRVETARFDHRDAREAPFDDDVDVVFMYLPFTGTALSTVMDRLLERWGRSSASRRRERFLCAGALDARYAELVTAAPSKSWLHVYAWRTPANGHEASGGISSVMCSLSTSEST